MSDTSEALPQARSGVGFGTVVRVVAIALGIMSAVLLARDGLKVSLNDFLDNVLNIYNGGVEYIALLLLGPAIAWALSALRDWFDWPLQLYPHWKHVTVLLWLYLGSAARYRGEGEGPKVLGWIMAGAFAVMFGVAAGTVPLSHPNVFWWPAASLFYFQSAEAASRAAFKRAAVHPNWWSQFAITGFPALLLGLWCTLEGAWGRSTVEAGYYLYWFWTFALFYSYLFFLALGLYSWVATVGTAVRPALLVALALGFPHDIVLLIQTATSPGLAALVVLGAVLGVGGTMEGLTSDAPEGGLSDDVAQTGLDKLAVLGGAALIVWLSHALG